MAKIYNNRYEVIEELGTGAFSVVYKAKILDKARKISNEGEVYDQSKNMANKNLRVE